MPASDDPFIHKAWPRSRDGTYRAFDVVCRNPRCPDPEREFAIRYWYGPDHVIYGSANFTRPPLAVADDGTVEIRGLCPVCRVRSVYRVPVTYADDYRERGLLPRSLRDE